MFNASLPSFVLLLQPLDGLLGFQVVLGLLVDDAEDPVEELGEDGLDEVSLVFRDVHAVPVSVQQH